MTSRIALWLAAVACASCGAFSPSAEDLRSNPHGHLVWAARTGDVAAIRALTARGVDLNASPDTPLKFVLPDIDHYEWTALQHAVSKRQVEAVRVLLELGANPDAKRDNLMATPLIIAAGDKDPTIARMLLAAGADINVSRQALTLEQPGGPLWHFVEHTMERVAGRQSAKEGLDRLVVAAGAR
jgi:ankyrin repeat protein